MTPLENRFNYTNPLGTHRKSENATDMDLKKQAVRVQTGFSWLILGCSGALCTRWWTLGLHERREVFLARRV